jgi:alpha-L-fucosidase
MSKYYLPSGLALILASASFAQIASPPAPYGPVPTAQQLAWSRLDYYAFLHFSINTFTDREWGNGDEDPKLFNPTAFDADQIVTALQNAGFKAAILTVKHHDGFCLWPSAFTDRSVKNSPWKNGAGDVVKEISDACRKHGLLFGIYLSPWDRNRPDYGQPEYLAYFRNQLRELLTNYGPIFEVWFDGANGGTGYYGGAGGGNERRTVDRLTYYDWPTTFKLVRELQPNAIIWSDPSLMTIPSDARWCGNEAGNAPDPAWSVATRLAPGTTGQWWMPMEVDVSLRNGWFYHPAEDRSVKTPDRLLRMYFESVGRNANLLLNIPPDRRGQIADPDLAALKGFKALLDQTFKTNLAPNATASATNTRANSPRFAPANVLTGKPDAYWSTDDDVKNPDLTLDFPAPVTFSIVRLREYTPLGQRLESVALDTWDNNQWHQFSTVTGIGACRLIRTPQPLTTTRLRLRITKAWACPALTEIGLW